MAPFFLKLGNFASVGVLKWLGNVGMIQETWNWLFRRAGIQM